MSGVPGVTCSKCLGRIDMSNVDLSKKIAAKLGKEWKPPKVCFECVMLVLLSDEEPDDALIITTKEQP